MRVIAVKADVGPPHPRDIPVPGTWLRGLWLSQVRFPGHGMIATAPGVGAIRLRNGLRRDAEPLDLPVQVEARILLDPAANLLAQSFDVGGRRAAGIDQEVAMHL